MIKIEEMAKFVDANIRSKSQNKPIKKQCPEIAEGKLFDVMFGAIISYVLGIMMIVLGYIKKGLFLDWLFDISISYTCLTLLAYYVIEAFKRTSITSKRKVYYIIAISCVTIMATSAISFDIQTSSDGFFVDYQHVVNILMLFSYWALILILNYHLYK